MEIYMNTTSKVLTVITAENVEKIDYTINEISSELLNIEFSGNRRRIFRLNDNCVAVINNTSRINIVKKLGAIQSKWIGHEIYPKEIKEMSGHKYIVWDVRS